MVRRRPPSNLSPREDLDRVAGAQLHDRLLPAGLRAPVQATPLRLRLHLGDVHADDLDVEQLLDGLAHLGLVSVRVDAERVLVVVDLRVRLLGHDRSEEDFIGMQAHEALPWTASSAASLTSNERAQTRAETSSSDGTVTTTLSRLRKDLITLSSSSLATTTSGGSRPPDSRSLAASCVEGRSNPAASRMEKEPFAAWAVSAPRKAARRALRLTLTSKLRAVGGKATPPPVQCGARLVPARARPVPFWRQGFERPPATSPRLLAARVPARPAL